MPEISSAARTFGRVEKEGIARSSRLEAHSLKNPLITCLGRARVGNQWVYRFSLLTLLFSGVNEDTLTCRKPPCVGFYKTLPFSRQIHANRAIDDGLRALPFPSIRSLWPNLWRVAVYVGFRTFRFVVVVELHHGGALVLGGRVAILLRHLNFLVTDNRTQREQIHTRFAHA